MACILHKVSVVNRHILFCIVTGSFYKFVFRVVYKKHYMGAFYRSITSYFFARRNTVNYCGFSCAYKGTAHWLPLVGIKIYGRNKSVAYSAVAGLAFNINKAFFGRIKCAVIQITAHC